jgi:hypothetical protein
VRFTGLQVDPALGLLAGLRIEPHQLAHAQPAAIEQFDDRRVARFHPGVGLVLAEVGELHRVIHAQRLGQRLRRFRRLHVQHRVAPDQPLAPEPRVEAAPAGEDQPDAAAAAPAAMHLRHPAPHVRVLHLQQRHARLDGVFGELLQVE